MLMVMMTGRMLVFGKRKKRDPFSNRAHCPLVELEGEETAEALLAAAEGIRDNRRGKETHGQAQRSLDETLRDREARIEVVCAR